MKSFFIRIGCFAILFGLGIFYGVDLANKGVEQIYGTDPAAVQSEAPEEVDAGQAAPPRAGYIEPLVENEQPQPLGQASAPEANAGNAGGSVNRLASGIGALLQNIAHGLVEFVLSIFDRVLR